MRNLLISLLVMMLPLGLQAQDEYEYKMEIGVGAGMTSYEGDFNGSIVKNMQPSASWTSPTPS